MNTRSSRWVVLGAGGFIGKNICLNLQKNGQDYIAFGRSSEPPEALKGCNWIAGNFFHEPDLANVLKADDIVVHAISTVTPAKSNELPITDVEENLIGALKLIEICKKVNVRKLIVLSSGGTVYGSDVPVPTPEDTFNEPICSYGIVKLAVEKYLALYRHQKKLDSIVLRVANPYGPHQLAKGQGVVAATIQKLLNNQSPEIWGDGNVIRDYIYIDDVVDAILAAGQLPDYHSPWLYNIGSGVGKSLNEIIASLVEIHGTIEVNRLPGRAVDVPISILDIQRACTHLNWRPRTSWDQGILLTYNWLSEELGHKSKIRA